MGQRFSVLVCQLFPLGFVPVNLRLGIRKGGIVFRFLPFVFLQGGFISRLPFRQLIFPVGELSFRRSDLILKPGHGTLIRRLVGRKLFLRRSNLRLRLGKLLLLGLFPVGQLCLSVVDLLLGFVINFIVPGFPPGSRHGFKLPAHLIHGAGIPVAEGGKPFRPLQRQIHVCVD